MDDLQIIERLDSLWLFSNVLSSRTQSLASVGDDSNGSAIQNHFEDSPKSETFKPMTPILQNQQTQSPNSEIVPQRCSQCGDLAVEVEEAREEEEKEERRKRSRRKLKNGLDQRRRIVKALDFGFDVNKDFGFCMMQKNKCGFERFGNEYDAIMPPFSDGMAMKEHLKSWAHAVACTVR